jgi:2-oxo-4-hydroxy-4-carboxy-5-ureidoimidazoline decarboxylase
MRSATRPAASRHRGGGDEQQPGAASGTGYWPRGTAAWRAARPRSTRPLIEIDEVADHRFAGLVARADPIATVGAGVRKRRRVNRQTSVAAFDGLPPVEAERELLTVCRAARWARAVAAGRPYRSVEALQMAAAAALTDADLDEAMAGHPRIGDRTAGGQSRREQSAVTTAEVDVLTALAKGNREYEERFGHVYLVCASGRSADDLLATLRARLRNDPATERAVALGELAAINRLRIARLFGEDGG